MDRQPKKLRVDDGVVRLPSLPPEPWDRELVRNGRAGNNWPLRSPIAIHGPPIGLPYQITGNHQSAPASGYSAAESAYHLRRLQPAERPPPVERPLEDSILAAAARRIESSTIYLHHGEHTIGQVGSTFEQGGGKYDVVLAKGVKEATCAVVGTNSKIDQIGHIFTNKRKRS